MTLEPWKRRSRGDPHGRLFSGAGGGSGASGTRRLPHAPFNHQGDTNFPTAGASVTSGMAPSPYLALITIPDTDQPATTCRHRNLNQTDRGICPRNFVTNSRLA